MNDNISLRDDNWINLEAAAEYLGVKPITIREWIRKTNDIPAHKIGKLEDEIIKRKTQAKQLKVFINDLSSRPDALEGWDENVWSHLIDKATGNKDRTITFLFRNGKEITVD